MDLQLVQALYETRRLAASRSDDDRWRPVAERTQRLIDLLGADGGDPLSTPLGHKRLKRQVMTPEHVRRAKGVMFALTDRDTDELLAAADDALATLEGELTARRRRRWSHRQDVIRRGAA